MGSEKMGVVEFGESSCSNKGWQMAVRTAVGSKACDEKISAGLVTSKVMCYSTSYSHKKVTSYLISYFLTIVTSYFTSYYKK